MNNASGGQRGSVLVAALWVVVILAVVAVSAARHAVMEHRVVVNRWESVRLAAGFRSAVYLALSDLRSMNSPGWDAPNQRWANAEELFKGRSFPGGRYDVVHEAEDQRWNGGADESGKIDLNLAPPDVIERVFREHPGVAAAVLDWRDPDDDRRLRGAEAEDYPGSEPRNGPFRSLEELLMVRGMTAEIFESVKPYLTIAGGAAVNINTASGSVLTALGMPDRMVARVKSYRQGPDGRWGTSDDGVFHTAAEIPAVLEGPWSTMENSALAGLLKRDRLGVRSRAVSLTMDVTMVDGLERGGRVVALARAWPPRIIEWREDPW